MEQYTRINVIIVTETSFNEWKNDKQDITSVEKQVPLLKGVELDRNDTPMEI